MGVLRILKTSQESMTQERRNERMGSEADRAGTDLA